MTETAEEVVTATRKEAEEVEKSEEGKEARQKAKEARQTEPRKQTRTQQI